MDSIILLALLTLAVAFFATRRLSRWTARLTISVVFTLLAPYTLMILVSAFYGTWHDLTSPAIFPFLLLPWLVCLAGAGIGLGLGSIRFRTRS